MDRHQGRIVSEVRLVQKLPGHGQRFFRGDAFFKRQDDPVIPPASPALLGLPIHLFGDGPLAVQGGGAQDGVLGQVPGFPAIAGALPKDVAGIGPGPALDRAGSHFAEGQAHPSSPVSISRARRQRRKDSFTSSEKFPWCISITAWFRFTPIRLSWRTAAWSYLCTRCFSRAARRT